MRKRERERQRQRQRDRETETERQRERQRQKQALTEIQMTEISQADLLFYVCSQQGDIRPKTGPSMATE